MNEMVTSVPVIGMPADVAQFSAFGPSTKVIRGGASAATAVAAAAVAAAAAAAGVKFSASNAVA